MPAPHAAPVTRFIRQNLSRCQAPLRLAVSRHGLDESELPVVEQDVRIRLWRAAERNHAGSATRAEQLPWSYLDRTVMSAVRDVRRRRCAHQGGLRGSVQPLDSLVLLGSDDVENTVVFRDLCRVVRECLMALPDARRQVVALHLDGADRRTIAKQLGYTEGRVRNLLTRGLATLRALLTLRGVGAGGFCESEGSLAPVRRTAQR